MIKTMPYWLYKTGYTEFNADNYDSKKKTIDVELPDYKKPRFPSEWRRNGNHYYAPNGCRVTFWNTGLSENFVVDSPSRKKEKTFPASLYARENVIEYVASFN